MNPLFVKKRVEAQLIGGAGLPEAQLFLDGIVPDTVPTYAIGDIKPYLVLFFGSGTDITGDRDLNNTVDYQGSVFRFQTTIAAATADQVLQTAHRGKRTLTGLLIETQSVKPDPDQQASATPLWDTTETPARAFLPLQWTIQTDLREAA